MQQPPGPLIPFVLAIDIEPDGQPSGRHAPLAIDGLRRTTAWIDRLRAPIQDATGAPLRVAWFVRLDAEIAERGGRPASLAELASDTLEAAAASGDAVGIHSHFSRWDPATDGWLVDHGNPAFVEDTLRSSFAAFERHVGQPARLHRFGDRWWSDSAFDTLADLGVTVDLTIEPGNRGAARADPTRAATGRIPDSLRDRSTIRRWRDGPLWQMPLSSADPARALPWHRRWVRRLRYAAEPRHRTLILDRAWPNPAAFWSVARDMLGSQAEPYLACAIRSDISLSPRFPQVEAILRELPAAGPTFAFETPEVALARVVGVRSQPAIDLAQRAGLSTPD
jgi:peptidoglycan/xylan/chitin deacetylase (PgdA/CDA1 family)